MKLYLPFFSSLGNEGVDPCSSPYIAHYSSFHFVFHSFIPSYPKASTGEFMVILTGTHSATQLTGLWLVGNEGMEATIEP